MIKQYPLSFMTLLLNLYAIRRGRNRVWYMLWLPINYYTSEIDYNISWWQWANNQNGKTEKQEFKGSLMDFFDILKQQQSYFLKHTYIKHMWSQAFISESESLKDDDSTVIEVNFAENYTMQIQNAIQSFYRYQSNLLYLLCAWRKKWLPFNCYCFRLFVS